MKLYKILSVVSMFSIFILSACSNDGERYNFYGKTDNWIVKYKTKISEEREWTDYSVEYIGKENRPEKFVYNLKSSWFEFGSEESFKKNDKVYSGNIECTGPPYNEESCEVNIEKDEKMKATLEWDGKSEVIEMYRK
ncbi:hypothetical protein [Metabacillus fastidiosus]|uniref:hypothetical protein n=1 Tax=Metabacillus fastidiosus TaxID=1458 RepID=UPI003D2DD7A2